MSNSDTGKKSDIVFEYKGAIYNRPLGRGVCFREESGELTDLQLEDMIPEGDFYMEIIVRKEAV